MGRGASRPPPRAPAPPLAAPVPRPRPPAPRGPPRYALAMPELPEVETIARDLRGLVAGARIAGAACNWPPTLRSHEPAAFAAAVAGREIQGVGRRGKQLLVWLGPGPAAAIPAAEARGPDDPSQDDRPAVRRGRPARPQDRHVHLVLWPGATAGSCASATCASSGASGCTGARGDGRAGGRRGRGRPCHGRRAARRRLHRCGDSGELLARRRGRLKTLLMNQDFLAGVGNIYADESLWRARLHPLRDATTLKPADVRRLHGALRDVLGRGGRRRGSSIDDYTAPEGDGSMQEHLQVYQRAGEPCLRCGRPIRRIVVGGRSTHFCSWCQRLPCRANRARRPPNCVAGRADGA